MATNSNCAACEKNGMCGQHHWVHVVIKICVAILIFWAGVQFGELRALLRIDLGGYSGRSMMGAYGGRDQVYIAPPMMTTWATSAVKTATTTKK